MKYVSLKYVAICLGLLLSACVAEYDRFTPYEQGVGDEAMQLLQENLQGLFSLQTELFTINPEDGAIFSTDAGTQFTLLANSFTDVSGSLVSEEVTIEVLDFKDKGDLIMTQTPTVAKGLPLESAGTFYIKAYTTANKEQLLKLNQPIRLQIPSEESPNDTYELFYGNQPNFQSNRSFDWLQASSSNAAVEVSEWLDNRQAIQNGYACQSDSLNWVACHRFLDEAVELTETCMSLPEPFNALNTLSFLVMKDINNVMRYWSDEDQSLFCIDYAPLGYSAVVVSISLLNETDYYLAYKDIEVNHKPIIELYPQPSSLLEIEEFLNSL